MKSTGKNQIKEKSPEKSRKEEMIADIVLDSMRSDNSIGSNKSFANQI
jgi:hypothetical protein